MVFLACTFNLALSSVHWRDATLSLVDRREAGRTYCRRSVSKHLCSCCGSLCGRCADRCAALEDLAQGHGLVAGAPLRAIVLPAEGDPALIERNQPLVGDRDTVGVARQIRE